MLKVTLSFDEATLRLVSVEPLSDSDAEESRVYEGLRLVGVRVTSLPAQDQQQGDKQ